ncbi:restriction endonuclease [Sutcliffiella cohnii]|uniref:restriction endonuclease n=1 Tax=Sutcliffiella cohnii TaxID=33932 RepID=UPI002E20871D|nr:restriction endonuclease [Sutcliffiella cohnii]
MLDFKELSMDGTDLERLVREIFVREGYETHWTGKGPDGGRDLLVIEKVQGPLSNFERTWLVQCKHKAYSGKSVGREESQSLVTDCKSAKADGYLLVCTTPLTTGLLTTYKELQSNWCGTQRDMGTGNSSTQKMEIDNNPKGRLLMNSHKENHVN